MKLIAPGHDSRASAKDLAAPALRRAGFRPGAGGLAEIGRSRIPLNALRAFEAVGRKRSFTGGAQTLNVTQGALSRQVAGLEALLQRRLLLRKPHGVCLTSEGAELLAAVTEALDAIEDALNRTLQTEADGARPVRLQLPPTFLRLNAAPLLRDFRRSFPDAKVDFTSHPRPGAALRDHDLVVVYGRADMASPGRDLLWRSRLTLICGPELARAAARLPIAEFVARNELLHVRHESRTPHEQWELFAARTGQPIDCSRGVMFETTELAAQYAAVVDGILLVDERCFVDEVASHRLVRPYDVSCLDDYGYLLAYQPTALDDPLVSPVRDWLIGRRHQGLATRGIPTPQ